MQWLYSTVLYYMTICIICTDVQHGILRYGKIYEYSLSVCLMYNIQ
jgi:hypothetical protein